MFTDECILCISSIDWDFIWQGHQEIMSRLARQGNRVLFIENTGVRAPGLRDLPRLLRRLRNWRKGVGGIREERENLYVFSPVVLPFPYSRLAQRINRRILIGALKRWMDAVGFHDPIIWTFLPTQLTLDVAGAIEHKLLLYYCIDNFAESSAQARKIKHSEERVIRSADLVFVTSAELERRCRRFNEGVHWFPFGVSWEKFEQARQQPRQPEDLARIGRPRIGYVGGVHQWVDQALVKALAERHPDYAFVFVGPLQVPNGLADCSNVFFLGQKSPEEVPQYIQHFDVCMIPYRLSEYTRNVYPTKLNEYLAMGKPVVATSLPEIERFNREYGSLISIGLDEAAFDAALRERLGDGRDGDQAARRIEVAKRNGWEVRIEEMCRLADAAIEQKRLAQTRSWKALILQQYRRLRRRIVEVAVGASLAYLILFHSPLLWWVASPLKLSQPPRQADAIVVFAGGVGESGEAGQGYQERVDYAVRLYRDGWAPLIVFSSGYQYVIREAELMKALAVSLGVPPEAILLEERAANTHQNVLLTTELLAPRGVRSILLVSSPYHMRRASMVYRRAAPQLTVLPTPIPHSGFYEGGRIRLRHYEAILHEYAAILSYWWRGWL
jgi:uncharacterized SAM-binding protein YcdF (DUF218 family)/glycosyltransferase involved in cell wall biosynthesis